MLTMEKKVADTFPMDFPMCKKQYTKEEKIDKLMAISQSLTQQEKDDLGRIMEEIERSKLTIYDDLRAR